MVASASIVVHGRTVLLKWLKGCIPPTIVLSRGPVAMPGATTPETTRYGLQTQHLDDVACRREKWEVKLYPGVSQTILQRQGALRVFIHLPRTLQRGEEQDPFGPVVAYARLALNEVQLPERRLCSRRWRDAPGQGRGAEEVPR